MLPVSDQVCAYLAARLPGAVVAVQRISDLAYSVHAMGASDDTYSIQVDMDTSDRLPAYEVLDADGDPVKNLFATWQDAADTVIAALTSGSVIGDANVSDGSPMPGDVEKC